MNTTKQTNLLEVHDLHTQFNVESGVVRAVDGASFSVKPSELLALVGESGCGKSMTAYSILRLIQTPGEIASGSIKLFSPDKPDHPAVDIAKISENDDRLYEIRGGKISMIFQEPMTALSPVHTIGDQICEAILLHKEVTEKEAESIAIDMLSKAGIPSAAQRIRQYPHELSGGMRQRVVIAMALACGPKLLIADEPTTALDVTTQAQILRLIKQLQQELGMAVLLITHDLGVVAQTADRVAVMYLGRIVEQAAVRPLIKNPRHPYTQGLLKSLPGLNSKGHRLDSIDGAVPSPLSRPAGCPFHPRCPHNKAGLCDIGDPPTLREIDNEHFAACHRCEEISS